MPETTQIEQIVARVVSQVLETHLPQLRDDMSRRVMEELRPHLEGLPVASSAPVEASPAAAESSPANLLKGIAAIHAGTTQREILRALLDSTVRYSGRSALFVIKAGAASGWEARGFADNDTVKNFALDVTGGVASRALQSRMVFSGPAAEMDSHFVKQFHAPHDNQVLVLPLLLKDKVAALVYADAGNEGGSMDTAALEVLVTATSAWLEVASLRKQAHKESIAEAGEHHEAAAKVQTVTSYSDPFAGHAPHHAASAAAPVAEAVSNESEAGTVAVEAAASPESAPAGMSAEDADVHRKAQRFARLLVDEIKLYNQVKVSEGRKNKDVYDRLKEDIEKSRATYMKRYGNTAARSGDYFSSELVRSLAEDDSSIMGANFRR